MSKTKEKSKETSKVNRHKRLAMGEKIELKEGGHVSKHHEEKKHKGHKKEK